MIHQSSFEGEGASTADSWSAWNMKATIEPSPIYHLVKASRFSDLKSQNQLETLSIESEIVERAELFFRKALIELNSPLTFVFFDLSPPRLSRIN